jgi:murein DD-endopeptidase MepM/ murein hydrolase activator NlpD
MSHDNSHRITFGLNIWLHLVIPAIFVALLLAAYATTLTKKKPANTPAPQTPLVQKLPELSPQNNISASQSNSIEIDILTRRLGILEAEALRLNAFGSRIVKMARLDPDEFAFEKEPSIGGASLSENQDNDYGIDADTLMHSIASLEKQLVDQRNRLEGMLQVLQGRILDKEILPDGMPIKKGYISSRFGFRRDPFTGKARMHKGIDYAGKTGTPVSAVAGGIITFAGRKGGYGNIIEVDHGDGLVSRYAHLSKIIGKRDQVVKKGDLIGRVGSTGRSTGPHLHLEVLKKGVQQNPAMFLKNRNK